MRIHLFKSVSLINRFSSRWSGFLFRALRRDLWGDFFLMAGIVAGWDWVFPSFDAVFRTEMRAKQVGKSDALH